MLKTKHLDFSFKSLTDSGTFEGCLSPYGNVDGGGDLVEPGAFVKTLQEQGSTRPLLWQHMTDCPIGQLSLTDKADGLYCKGNLLMNLPEAQKAYSLMKAGICKGLSIGFQTMRDSIESGVRHLKEIKLYEGSIVTFPMNEMAQVSSVKSATEFPNFRRALAGFRAGLGDITKGEKNGIRTSTARRIEIAWRGSAQSD